jgi:hypothetical protein
MRFADFVLTPRDVWHVIRHMNRRDWLGLALVLVIGIIVALWLADPSAGLFAAGLIGALFWRIDSRWPFGLALAALVLIPLMQAAYQRNWLFQGEAISQGLAVAVWYLLAIGVVRQIVELRQTSPAAATETAALAAETPPEWAQSSSSTATVRRPLDAPIPFHKSLRRQRMVARRVLAKVDKARYGMDGIRRQSTKR